MNAVEIEAAISDLAMEPFNVDEFPYAFLAAFGNKDTTLKRLRTGTGAKRCWDIYDSDILCRFPLDVRSFTGCSIRSGS